jgi:hypothetical protein
MTTQVCSSALATVPGGFDQDGSGSGEQIAEPVGFERITGREDGGQQGAYAAEVGDDLGAVGRGTEGRVAVSGGAGHPMQLGGQRRGPGTEQATEPRGRPKLHR